MFWKKKKETPNLDRMRALAPEDWKRMPDDELHEFRKACFEEAEELESDSLSFLPFLYTRRVDREISNRAEGKRIEKQLEEERILEEASKILVRRFIKLTTTEGE